MMCPNAMGRGKPALDRFTRWERDGTWQHILQTLQAHADAVGEIDWDGAALDSSHIKAHRSAAGARKRAAKHEKRGV